MRRIASLLLLIPFALGYIAGVVVLGVVLLALAARDGYRAGRRKPE